MIHLPAQSIFEISFDLQVSKSIIHNLLDILCSHGVQVTLVTFMIRAALIDFLVDSLSLTSSVVQHVWRISGLRLREIPCGLLTGIGSSGVSYGAPFFKNLITRVIRLTSLKA